MLQIGGDCARFDIFIVDLHLRFYRELSFFLSFSLFLSLSLSRRLKIFLNVNIINRFPLRLFETARIS